MTSRTFMIGCDSSARPSLLARARQAVYEGLRRPLRRLGFGHQRWPLTFAVLDLIFDPRGTAAPYDREFAERIDPWNYARNSSERLRHRLAAELLDRARHGRNFARALEIGCAEGMFTQLLTERCGSVLAVDFSELALERTGARMAGLGTVSVARWNLRTDPFPGKFDLIVAMDVLTSLLRPRDARAARAKIIAAMRPGDHLLVGDHRQSPVFEKAWWGKVLVRGGKWIVRGFVDDPALECLDHVMTETHVLALLRKR